MVAPLAGTEILVSDKFRCLDGTGGIPLDGRNSANASTTSTNGASPLRMRSTQLRMPSQSGSRRVGEVAFSSDRSNFRDIGFSN